MTDGKQSNAAGAHTVYDMLTLTTGIYIIFRIIIILHLCHSWTKQTKQRSRASIQAQQIP